MMAVQAGKMVRTAILLIYATKRCFCYLLARSRSNIDSLRRREGRQINLHEVHLIRRLPARVRIGAKKNGS
jgi:hypothetical protein